MAQFKPQKSGSYLIREVIGWDASGKPEYRSHYLRLGTSPEEAKAELRRVEAREAELRLLRSQGKATNTKSGQIPFGPWAMDVYLPKFIAAYPRSAVKKRKHLEHLNRIFHDCPLGAERGQLLALWNDYRKMRTVDDKVTMSTLEAEFASFKRVLNQAVKLEVIQHNPFSELSFRADVEDIGGEVYEVERRIFTHDELEAIYEAGGEFWGAQWRIISNTGLRRGEVFQMPKRNVTKEHVFVEHAPKRGLSVKSKVGRKVKLSEGAQEAREIILFHTRKSGDQFFSSRVEPVVRDTSGASAFSKAFRAHADDAGIPDGTMHGLRHTFISMLANEKGVPLPLVQKLAGHAQISTTMRYVHETDEQLDKAIGQIDW
jgi:integrase